MATAWFYMVDGEEVGPISPAELKSLAQSGKVTRTDRVRRGDMTEWKIAGSIKGLIAPDEMKVPDVAPSIRSASKVKSSLSVPQESQEAHLNAGKSDGFMSASTSHRRRRRSLLCANSRNRCLAELMEPA